MIRYEYKFANITSEYEINKLGDEGWMLVGKDNMGDPVYNSYSCIFMREKLNDPYSTPTIEPVETFNPVDWKS